MTGRRPTHGTPGPTREAPRLTSEAPRPTRLTHETLGAGTPSLFLENLSGPPETGRALAPVLTAAGHLVLLVDHPGTGADLAAVARDVAALLDELDVTPTVWGHSQGALLAQELALARPDRVRAVALVATRGRPSPFHDAYLAALRACEDPAVSDELAAVLDLLATVPPGLLARDDIAELALAGAHRRREARDPERTLRSLRLSAGYGDRLAALRELAVPALVVAFEQDVVCPPALGREVADAVPGCAYREIAGAGHGGLLTHAPEVLDAVTGFLAAHAGRPRGVARA